MHKRKGNLIGLSLSLVILTACAQNEKKKDSAGQEEIKQNQLANAKSPYLLQHADNPVDWYEWGPEALEKAKKENKPLIISIGYASCHWCHVMEHESFMDSSVAKIMNENFVPVKIDREERPDIDQVYMNAVQLLTGSGGWPLNAFALPNGKPFYAGTYYPRDQWMQVLKEIAAVYKNQHEKVVQQANLLTEGIKGQEVITIAGDSSIDFTKNTYTGIFDGWQSRIDYTRGGYKGAPKFPLPAGWEFLLQFHYLTEDDKALDAVNQTLDAMAKGGIYDQVGGGFARYSTDARWFAPHFEKMLYDNGQLVSLYSHAYKVTKNETYARVIRETLEFIKREMTGPKGEFHSSLNADSEGEEGKFYVWRMEEIEEVLEPRTATLITDYYQLEKGGNWEGKKNILFRKKNMQEFAKEHQLSFQEWDNILSEAKSKMLKARSRRSRPSTDDKVLTGWNALMMQGYLDAYLALGEPDYLQAALKNARFLEETMLQPNGRLWRNYREGEAGINAFLDDYALLGSSYIHLYQATFDVHWLNLAKKIAEYAVSHFRDEKSGMFFYTSDESETLIARKMEITDNVIPSSNSVMANVLYRLGEYYYHEPYIDMSVRMLNHVVGEIPKGGPYYANWGMLMGLITFEPYEIAIMGIDASTKNKAMQARYLPTSLFMGGKEENLILLENKLIPGETRIYVCRNKTCKMPVNDVNQAFEQLKW